MNNHFFIFVILLYLKIKILNNNNQVVSYAYLYECIGEEVHKFIGDEPSGLIFNAPVLDNKNRPHNPLINSGAIMVCALLVKHNKKLEDILEFYKRASSTENIEVDYD